MTKRVILLPKDISTRLNDLASKVKNEVDGLLFYTVTKPVEVKEQDRWMIYNNPRETYCTVDALFITGVGSEGHVRPREDAIEVANEFLRKNGKYFGYIKFHTHSNGTIEKAESYQRGLGEYNATHFSNYDLKVIKEELKDNPMYIAMLVTPKKKIIAGQGGLELRIIEDFNGFREIQSKVKSSLEKIRTRLGYDEFYYQALKYEPKI